VLPGARFHGVGSAAGWSEPDGFHFTDVGAKPLTPTRSSPRQIAVRLP
jgi:hypothetical protein